MYVIVTEPAEVVGATALTVATETTSVSVVAASASVTEYETCPFASVTAAAGATVGAFSPVWPNVTVAPAITAPN